MIPPEVPRLRVKIENTEPVELLDLTRSFLALSDEYARFVADNPGYGELADVKLYVEEIRAGSIIADFVNNAHLIAPAAVLIASDANAIIDFGKHLGAAVKRLLTPTRDEQPPLPKKTLKNIGAVVEPVAKDNGAVFSVSTVVQGDQNVTQNITHVHVTSNEANVVQNRARLEIEKSSEPTALYREQVAMYWHQSRPYLDKDTGDWVIIESISGSPVRVGFASPELKAEALSGDPYDNVYVVDVQIETVQRKPVFYRITRIHHSFPRDNPGQANLFPE